MHRSLISFHHVASAPSGIDMMSDDDSTSRDSGVSMTMDENMPMCFSSLSVEMQSHVAEESMDVDEEVSRAVEKPSKGIPFGRQNSACNKTLFVGSNTPRMSRDSTGALTVRSSNLQDHNNRKRPMLDGAEEEYQQKRERSSDHYHLEPTGESAEDVIDVIEQEMGEDSTTASEYDDFMNAQQSSSTATSSFDAFALPRDTTRRKPTGSLVHHRTVPNVRIRNEEDTDENHLCVQYHLATTGSMCSTSFRRIGAETMVNLLMAMPDEEFNEKYILIDCRYPFEYNAGHIKHAINFYDPELVYNLFYSSPQEKRHCRIPIFYCEFSQKRGPSMANALRKLDRHLNFSNYPRCSFEEMYVLDKGYREFHRFTTKSENTSLCQPHAYVEMIDDRYSDELRKYQHHKRSLPNATVRRFYHEACQFSLVGALPITIAKPLPPSGDEESPEEERAPEQPQQRHNRLHGMASNKTPQVSRQMSRRALFESVQESPTNFGDLIRPESNSPSPVKPSTFPEL